MAKPVRSVTVPGYTIIRPPPKRMTRRMIGILVTRCPFRAAASEKMPRIDVMIICTNCHDYSRSMKSICGLSAKI